MLDDNNGWPESFGFSIAGDAPVVVVNVLENSIAASAGLHVGDQILEINDANVRGLSKEQVILVARRSKRIPPALAVISRIRKFRLQRSRRVGFGLVFRGSKPVHVHSVIKNSPAYEAGICPGDMVIQINGRSAKRLIENEANKLLELSGNTVNLKLIAGSYSIKKFEERFSSSTLSRHKKARDFFKQMNYYLTGEEHKKTWLITLLKRYARDRDIERFSRLISSLLTTNEQRKLLKPVRYFIPTRHQPYFDAIVNQNYAGSVPDTYSPRDTSKHSPRSKANDIRGLTPATSTPFAEKGRQNDSRHYEKLTDRTAKKEPSPRSVKLQREASSNSFGFTISGCNPVFIRSVDEDGPAIDAGLKAGDCILEINEIDVRHASHENVIKELKNSGNFTVFLVQWRPIPASSRNSTSPVTPRNHLARSEMNQLQSQQESNSISDSALEIDISPRNGYHNNIEGSGFSFDQEPSQADLLRHLKEQMKKLLTRGEQLVVKQALAFFHDDRDVSKLVEALEPVLDDPLKLQMLHCISRLLPGPAQLEFEKQAVDMVARHMENGIIISATATDHELFNILFRVQGSKLNETDRPRNLIGGLVDVKPESSSPSSKAVSNSTSTGSFASDLDQTPSKEEKTLDLRFTPEKDSTFEALMSIDEDKLGASPSQGQIIVTADVEKGPISKQSSQPKKRHSGRKNQDANNNIEAEKQNNSVQETLLDEEEEEMEIGNDRNKLTEEDIKKLKAELILAQEEAKFAKKEAEDRRLQLESQSKSTGNNTSTDADKSKSIADEIKEKSFEMEPEKIRTASTDDHVVLPGQFPPPGMMPPPPPPPVPPAPPPPPPPSGPGMKAMQLKRINWEKLSGPAIENTVWGKLGNEDQVDNMIVFMDLEQLFSTKKNPVKEKKVEKKQTSILDSKKQYNLSLLLGHLKMPVDEMYKAVLALDETRLSEPHIRTLLMCIPERPEIEAYKSYSEDPATMSSADAFTSKMLSIPNYGERLRAMLFKARFNDRVNEIKPDIESVSLASEEVKSSKKLMKILEIVLATGNYMNQGSTKMSGASGFKISFLTKLISTRTSDNKSTLLHVIVNTIKNNKSELLDVKDELTHVPLAAKVSSQLLSLEMSELRTGMKEIKEELKNYQAIEGDITDKFAEVIGKFVKDAEQQFEGLISTYDKMQNLFNSSSEFYSESKITTEDFFGAFAIFLQHFENVKKDVMSEEERKEYQARKEKELEEMRKRRNSTVSRGRSMSNSSTTQIDENEIQKGFEAVMRKRSQSHSEHTHIDIISAEAPSKDAVKQIDQSVSDLQTRVTTMDIDAEVQKTNKSEDTISKTIAVADASIPDAKSPGKNNATNKVQQRDRILTDALKVLPSNESIPFSKLLSRRARFEDTDSERERADSSASDTSVFSTMPRTKAKPPPPFPKKKKPPAPPIKPKPARESINLKSSTLPKSFSSHSNDNKYDSDASRGSSSGSSSRNNSEQSNTPERTWSLSSNGSFKTDTADFIVSDIHKIETISEADTTDGKSIQDTDHDSPRIKLTKLSKPNHQQHEVEFSKNQEGIENVEVQDSEIQTKNSKQVIFDMGRDLPTYTIEVSQSCENIDACSDQVNEKPKKPTRKNTDPSQYIKYKPSETVDNGSIQHDDDDYANLPQDNVDQETSQIAEALNSKNEEPDSFKNEIDNVVDIKGSLRSGRKASQQDPDPSQDKSDVVNKRNEDISIQNDVSLSNAKPVHENLDSGLAFVEPFPLNLANNNHGNIPRSSSFTSSQSSDSDSPKSYRKFKQSRGSSSKAKLSAVQKIKDAFGSMRSRSSSDASTTSNESITESKRKISTTKLEPKPILKKQNQNVEHQEHNWPFNRPHSPHTVTFQDLPTDSELKDDIIKISTDDESLPGLSVKIPPMPKSIPPPPPSEPAPPPQVPSPYHSRKFSNPKVTEKPSDAAEKRVVSKLTFQIPSPPPPPPPPMKPTQPLSAPTNAPAELSPLSPTLPQFKPPPPPFLAQMKSQSSAMRSPAPSLESPLSQESDVSKELLATKPPPPPKRIQSIKSPPLSARSTSPVSSAELVRKASSNLSSPLQSRKSKDASKETQSDCLEINAEFDSSDDGFASHEVANREMLPTAYEKTSIAVLANGQPTSIQCPTPPPDIPTAPLDDVPIVPPPPSPSPPKADYLSHLKEHSNTDSDFSNSVPESLIESRPSNSIKPGFMIKVLPKIPPKLHRGYNSNDADSEEDSYVTDTLPDRPIEGSYKTSSVDMSSGLTESNSTTRTNRTNSVSSISSMTFPPLPPASLLIPVEEDYNSYHNSQTIIQF